MGMCILQLCITHVIYESVYFAFWLISASDKTQREGQGKREEMDPLMCVGDGRGPQKIRCCFPVYGLSALIACLLIPLFY